MLRKGRVTLAWLFLSAIFLGCHPTPKGVVDPGAISGSRFRPIDADPASVELFGREMLEKVGYAGLLNLARQAGFVTTKEIEGAQRNDGALLAMGGASSASGFIEVFSRYALAAGVTSQADSPLPGPADAVAIGIIALGLFDAGLLDGAILGSLGDVASSATSSTTSGAQSGASAAATAAPIPTVAAPPLVDASVPLMSKAQHEREGDGTRGKTLEEIAEAFKDKLTPGELKKLLQEVQKIRGVRNKNKDSRKGKK